MPLGRAFGGAERLLQTLVRRAPEQGIDVRVVYHEPGPSPGPVVALGRFRDVRTGARAVRALRALVARERPDLVLAWLPRAYPYLLAAAGRTPTAWWQHHNGEGEQALTRLVTALPSRGIVCTSQAVADIQARVPPRRRLLVVHPGVEEPVVPGPEELARLRARLGIAPDAVVAALPGRLAPWKGHDRFLAALERVPPITGLVVGGDDPRAAERLRSRGAIVTGHVEDPTPFLALADVVVNASENEPFGMTLPEAMALGRPVLAVGRGGPREIVRDGVDGVLVPDGSPDAIAAGLRRVLAAPGLGAAGRERYAERFTARAFAARAADALRSLA